MNKLIALLFTSTALIGLSGCNHCDDCDDSCTDGARRADYRAITSTSECVPGPAPIVDLLVKPVQKPVAAKPAAPKVEVVIRRVEPVRERVEPVREHPIRVPHRRDGIGKFIRSV